MEFAAASERDALPALERSEASTPSQQIWDAPMNMPYPRQGAAVRHDDVAVLIGVDQRSVTDMPAAPSRSPGRRSRSSAAASRIRRSQVPQTANESAYGRPVELPGTAVDDD